MKTRATQGKHVAYRKEFPTKNDVAVEADKLATASMAFDEAKVRAALLQWKDDDGGEAAGGGGAAAAAVKVDGAATDAGVVAYVAAGSNYAPTGALYGAQVLADKRAAGSAAVQVQ